MTVKYFGKIAETVEKSIEVWSSKNNTVGAFKTELILRYPQLNIETLQIAVNLELAADVNVINERDEVAVLPQFAGG